MAAAIFFATFIYVTSFLPESFPEERRIALSHMHPEHSNNGSPPTTRLASLHVFKPLKLLIPTPRLDGTRNWRFTWCATHTFVFMVASEYALTAWLVLATSKYHLTPADVSSIGLPGSS